jgi:hypothetical protein
VYGKVVCMKGRGGSKREMQDAEDETKDYSVLGRRKESSGLDEVRGEQRRSVSFIAHSRHCAKA